MIPPRWIGRLRAAAAGLLLAGGPSLTGCAPALDPAEYGQVIFKLPQVQGADRPFPLPELDEPAEKPKEASK